MPIFSIVNQHALSENAVNSVTQLHFGANALINYDQLLDGSSDYLHSIAELKVQTLRYPGGAVTEQYIDVNNPEASSVEFQGATVELVPLTAFLEAADGLAASVTIVIPTRNGLSESAEAALMNGTYGDRKPDRDFVADAAAFATEAMKKAIANGVEIDAFEIGNEFWGSGKMSATEYGGLAAELTVAIETELIAVGIDVQNQPQIIIQGIAAPAKYSPTPGSSDDLNVYLLTDGTLWSAPENFNVGDTPPAHVGVQIGELIGNYQIPTEGWIKWQNKQILDQLRAVDGAIDAMDGFVLHYYGDPSIEDIDTFDQSIFEMLDLLMEIESERSNHLPDLVRFITEWNIRASSTHPNNEAMGGLIQASYMVEMFYEMISHGITSAHAWPLRNEGAQLSSLFHVSEGGLSIAGEAFRMMSESTVGLAPVVDFNFEMPNGTGHIDVHGYESASREVLFVSERAELEGIQTLDLSRVLFGADYFITVELLTTDQDETNPKSDPVMLFQNGYTASGNQAVIDVYLEKLSLALVEITYVTNGADILIGKGGNDRIFGKGGGDMIFGGSGEDALNGDGGSDELYGGPDDDVIYGGFGSDIISGDEGADSLYGQAGDDFIFSDAVDFLVDGGIGHDVLSLESSSYGLWISIAGGYVFSNNWSMKIDNFEEITGSMASDYFIIANSDVSLYGGGGGDIFQCDLGEWVQVFGGVGADAFYIYFVENSLFSGGDDDDFFFSWSGNNIYSGGAGDDSFSLLNDEVDTFLFDQGDGDDFIKGFDASEDVLDFSSFHLGSVEFLTTDTGTLIELGASTSVFLFGVFDDVSDLQVLW